MGYDDAQLFETPRINNHSATAPSPLIFLGGESAHSFESPPKNNHGVTAPSACIFLGSDSLKCQHKNRTHRSGQKLSPPGKEYIFFQMGGKTSHSAQCSCSLTNVIDLILYIESFEQQCVIIKGLLQSY